MNAIHQIPLNVRKFFVALSVLCAIYLIPLVLAQVPFLDDVNRNSSNQTGGWLGNGRPLAEILFTLLSLGNPVINFAPLPQILAMGALVITGCIIYAKLLPDRDPLWSALILFLFIGNPFLIENLSFQFDSLSMMLSVLLSTIALYFKTYQGLKQYSYRIFILLSAMCFYQSSLGIFICLALLTYLEKPNTKVLIENISICLASYLLYQIVGYFTIQGWIGEHSKSIFTVPQPFSVFLANIINLWEMVRRLFTPFWLTGFLLLFIAGYICHIYAFFIIKKSTAQYHWFYKLTVFSAPFLLIIFTFLPFLILYNPILSPRVFLSVAVINLYIGIYFTVKLPNFNILRHSFILFMVAMMILRMFSYGNFLMAQDKYNAEILNNIQGDLKSHNLLNEKHPILLTGILEIPEQISIILKHYPLFEKYIYSLDELGRFIWYTQGKPFWTAQEFIDAEGTAGKNILQHKKAFKEITSNRVYKIYTYRKIVIIDYQD